MLRMGVTGGLGSGKSAMSDFFREKGAVVFDADIEAKFILLRTAEVQQALIDSFGETILNEIGELDFKRLADFAFAKPERQQRLNEIVHPEVMMVAEQRMIQASRKGVDLFIFDAALLFESGLEGYLDITVTVIADEELRVQRALARGHLTEEDIRRRIKLQLPDEEKAKRADFVIANNGTEEEFHQKLEDLYLHLTAELPS